MKNAKCLFSEKGDAFAQRLTLYPSNETEVELYYELIGHLWGENVVHSKIFKSEEEGMNAAEKVIRALKENMPIGHLFI